jgi:hypothetical protein
VAAAAQAAASTASTSTDKWWKKQAELWVDVHTEEEFHREVSTGDRLVFVGESRSACSGGVAVASTQMAVAQCLRC